MWQRVLPKLFVGLMVIVGIFGIGSYWRSGEKPLNVSTKQLTANSPGASKNSTNQPAPINTNSSVQQVTPSSNIQSNKQFAPQSANLTIKPQAIQTEPAPLSAAEKVYYCGAMTKKGTPCSRRVKGGGRCWQHKGQNSMLPPEKLLASQ